MRCGAVTGSANVRCDSARCTGAVRACHECCNLWNPANTLEVYTTRSKDPIIHDASGGTPCRGPKHMHA